MLYTAMIHTAAAIIWKPLQQELDINRIAFLSLFIRVYRLPDCRTQQSNPMRANKRQTSIIILKVTAKQQYSNTSLSSAHLTMSYQWRSAPDKMVNT